MRGEAHPRPAICPLFSLISASLAPSSSRLSPFVPLTWPCPNANRKLHIFVKIKANPRSKGTIVSCFPHNCVYFSLVHPLKGSCSFLLGVMRVLGEKEHSCRIGGRLREQRTATFAKSLMSCSLDTLPDWYIFTQRQCVIKL